mmetsp:Transcript_18046/g.26832  ORF Transcript_18046/g.26832 Transcript_18046/m.26832 type:complete len:807 (+) Transcript_18046:1599-4019(+)
MCSEHQSSLPWEIHVEREDGYSFVYFSILACFVLQVILHHLIFQQILPVVGSSCKGAAKRLSVKCVSVLFDCIAIAGGIKELLNPELSVIVDPLYGFSSHSQFHYSVAAGYFGWASIVTLLYGGSNVSLMHHVLCCAVYLTTLHPFLHHIGNLFLLFQSSTLVVDIQSIADLLGQKDLHLRKKLQRLHTLVFVCIRIVVGIPLSTFWALDMIEILRSDKAHSQIVILCLLLCNMLISSLNVYWGISLCLGTENGRAACSVAGGEMLEPDRFFELGFRFSYPPKSNFNLSCNNKSGEDNANLRSPHHSLLFFVAAAWYCVKHEGLLDDFSVGILLIIGAMSAFFLYKFRECLFPEISTRAKDHLYTRIHGVWYDLAGFNHPGGPVALNLSRGRDSTELFESHHYLMERNRLMQLLGKFRVDDKVAKALEFDFTGSQKYENNFDWKITENDEFVRDLKKMIIEHFTPIAKARGITLRQSTKATPKRLISIAFMMFSFFATLPFFFNGVWWTLFATPFLAWVTIANYWHDGLHFALSCDWRINATLPYLFPWLSSPWLWYHQHVLGHHAYTNIGFKDPDLAHAPQLMREHSSIKWKRTHRYQYMLPHLAFVWGIAVFGLQVINDIKANLKGSYNNTVAYSATRMRIIVHLLGRVAYVLSMFVWPFVRFSLGKGFIFATVPITIFSWLFMACSQVNHLVEPCSNSSSSNYFKHQVLTSQNFGIGHFWSQLLTGGLNQQIEHHLFPCVNHCHLPDLAPKVKQICAKHGVGYLEAPSFAVAFKQHLEHTHAMSMNTTSVNTAVSEEQRGREL